MSGLKASLFFCLTGESFTEMLKVQQKFLPGSYWAQLSLKEKCSATRDATTRGSTADRHLNHKALVLVAHGAPCFSFKLRLAGPHVPSSSHQVFSLEPS